MKVKKILTLILSVLLLFALCSCVPGEYVGPDSSGGNSASSSGSDSGSDSSGGGTSDGEIVFTVSLICGNQSFSPAGQKEPISACWTDKSSANSAFYTAEFDSRGVASITGLDGDYKVTLTRLPEGYTYNPNIYEADNDSRNVSIVLYPLTVTSAGSAIWPDASNKRAVSISSTGAYRATLTRANYEEGVRFQYNPKTSGYYSIQSLIDVTANKLNPIIDIYLGNTAWVPPSPTETRDGGGDENTYTKNFRWEIDMANDEASTFWFVIRATTLAADVFPINVDFILDKDGEFTGNRLQLGAPVYPTEDFANVDKSYIFSAENTAGSFRYLAYDDPNHVLRGNKVKYYAKEEGGDGYYHLYDEETGTYGKLLYVNLLNGGPILQEAGGFTYEMVSVSNCNGLNYNAFFYEVDEDGTIKCDVDSSGNVTKRMANYGTNCRNGYYPVNAELKEFLMSYSVGQRLFNDGNGWAESCGFNSSETDQWLFNCGYYA